MDSADTITTIPVNITITFNTHQAWAACQASPSVFMLTGTKGRYRIEPKSRWAMIRTPKLFLVIALLFIASAARATPRPEYVGRSACDPIFKRSQGISSIRLDKTQRAYLVARTVKDENFLLIVQCSDENDHCGVVRDGARSENPNYFFEFDCIDGRTPATVVVGTRKGDDPQVVGEAAQAWQIDLKKLKFVQDHANVVCTRSSYAGPDQGEDLVGMAKLRTSNSNEKR